MSSRTQAAEAYVKALRTGEPSATQQASQYLADDIVLSVQTRNRATLAQLGGKFLGTSISSKMLLSREPWSLTQSAIV